MHRNGFALAAAMMVLALLSVLGAAAIQSTTLEVKISAHDRDARTALYVAQAALEEARYYAARSWGKVSAPTLVTPGTATVSVTTPLAPGLAWGSGLYAGFTLVDRLGTRYPVLDNGGTASPSLLLDTAGRPDPAAGPFVLVREIPPANTTWDGARLVVADTPWATVSSVDTWAGWTLWNGDGDAFPVSASAVDLVATPAEVELSVPADPSPGPYTLTINPWVAALAGGLALPGDADADPAAWDRTFSDAGGAPLGTASVTAVSTAPGAYRITATGTTGTDWGRVEMQVKRAGWRSQTVGDWKVADEI